MQTLATSETGAVHDRSGWCLVEESISPIIKELLEDRSSDMRNEEYMVAAVTDDKRTRETCPVRPQMEMLSATFATGTLPTIECSLTLQFSTFLSNSIFPGKI